MNKKIAKTSKQIDPINLTSELIKCPSVTPSDEGAIDLLDKTLTSMGFSCQQIEFQEPGTKRVNNLYAEIGDNGKNFCFAGHSDVVPIGDGWDYDPFGGQVVDGKLFGRGASDMKGAIACFISAVGNYLEHHGIPKGTISLLITGDEEGPAINGTKKVLNWLKSRNKKIDFCVVGEPTNPEKIGEMVKVGRRGSVNAKLTAHGVQGHVAYPHLAKNPINILHRLISALLSNTLDNGNEFFQPSNLSLTSIDVGNTVTNVIPSDAHANFNIRFNNIYNKNSIKKWIKDTLNSVASKNEYSLETTVTGDSFLSESNEYTSIVSNSIKKIVGMNPKLSTTGGTSDARFIHEYCPVCEFGLIGKTMHKVNEFVYIDDLMTLTNIYNNILNNFFLHK